MKTRAKYNNKKVEFNGIIFDSSDECKYYKYLLNRIEVDEKLPFDIEPLIKNIELQPKFVLIPSYCYFGKKCREITYTPDFKITYDDGTVEYIDVKGMETQQSILRRKLFEHKYPNLLLTWVSRNIKYGDKDGWIDYDQLKKLRLKAKKDKKAEE